MKKSFLIGLSLLAVSAASGFCLSEEIEQKGPVPAVFFSEEGTAWVEKCAQKHSEILWLADASVRKTEEGKASLQESYSEQLFGQKFIEFDRTLMTLHCLKLFLDGSDAAYQEFTKAQPQETKLSRESFQRIYLQGQQLVKSRWGALSELEMVEAMETALVLGDMGKSEKAREIFKSYRAAAPDHDDFHGEAMQVLSKNPQLCPSFIALSESAKKLLIKSANLAHYGHITHLEGGPSMFDHLKESQIALSDPTVLSFDLFIHTCDVAGALGHVDNCSSLVYTESTHKAMEAMKDAVWVLADSSKTTKDAYQAYMTTRAQWLGLNSENGVDRVLARIGAMLRLFTPEEGTIVKEAMMQIMPEQREKIMCQLDAQKSEQLARTPTYMPAVLVNLLNNSMLGKTKEERLVSTITLGLPFLCRVLEMHKEQLAKLFLVDPNIPLNFNKMAGIAKTAPHLLSQECKIDKEGNVELSSP